MADRFYQSFIYMDNWKFFAQGFVMTLLLTLASFLGGTLAGTILCALQLSRNKVVSIVTKRVTSFLVEIPTLVLLMVFVYILFHGTSLSVTLVVIFGLILKAGAYLSEIFRSAVLKVSTGEAEAARTLGMSARQTFWYITLPQAVDTALPLYQNQFIACLQETSIVGTLAVMDITKASSVVVSRTLDATFGVIFISIVYLLLGFIGSRLLGILKNRRHMGGEQNV